MRGYLNRFVLYGFIVVSDDEDDNFIWLRISINHRINREMYF